MSRVILIAIVALLSAGLAWGVWAFALKRPDMQMQLYARSAELRAQAARPKPADPHAFRATACAAGPCVLVEADGQAILVGAAEGVAQGLEATGLMRADLKAVLLTDLSPRSIEGLPALRDAMARAGRHEALTVFGPPGIERVVAGANAMMEGDVAALAAGVDAEGGVFRAGGLVVSSVPAAGGAGRTYRFDFAGKALMVAGCGASAEDIVAAARGASSAYAVLPAASATMAEIERNADKAAGRNPPAKPGVGCLSIEDVSKVAGASHLAGVMLAPLYPAPKDAAAVRAWGVAATGAGVPISVGAPGVTLTLDAIAHPGASEVAGVASPVAAPAAASPAAEVIPAPKPSPTVAPKPVETPAPKPVAVAPPRPAVVAPTRPVPSPSAAVTASPRPRNTPKPVATASAPPSPEPSPVVTPSETPEPPPSPIFPLRNGIPSTDSPLRVGPRLSPTPSATPSP